MKKNKKTIQYIPYQLCPKCNGEGTILKNNFNGTSINPKFETCPVCKEAMIIPMYIVKPEEISLTDDKIH